MLLYEGIFLNCHCFKELGLMFTLQLNYKTNEQHSAYICYDFNRDRHWTVSKPRNLSTFDNLSNTLDVDTLGDKIQCQSSVWH